jgi:hypothetical protein
MPLPTMSLRAPPEHHQLIRDIATALRTRPELADVLRDVLQTQHGSATKRVAQRDTDVLQTQHGDTESVTDVLHAFQERLTIQSEGLQKIMAFAENIDKRVKALERSAGTHEETGTANGPP